MPEALGCVTDGMQLCSVRLWKKVTADTSKFGPVLTRRTAPRLKYNILTPEIKNKIKEADISREGLMLLVQPHHATIHFCHPLSSQLFVKTSSLKASTAC
jgi:hypothetical protein